MLQTKNYQCKATSFRFCIPRWGTITVHMYIKVTKNYFEHNVWIRLWSLIHNEKPIVLFERHCQATEKLEAIACARRCRSSRLTRWWTQKEQSEKMEGQGGVEAQGVADPKKCLYSIAPKSHKTQKLHNCNRQKLHNCNRQKLQL
jgi:hypothetical protein